MSNKYTLGEYEFDTYEEYLEAEEDLKKIDLLTEQFDINDPVVAARLYTRIRNKEIVFRGKVGIGFFTYLSDIMSNHCLAFAEEKKVEENRKQQNKKTSRRYVFAAVVCILLAAGSLSYFTYRDYQNEQSEAQIDKLRDMKSMTGNYIQVVNDDGSTEEFINTIENLRAEAAAAAAESGEDKIEIDESLLTVLPEYQTLHDQNRDFVAWLTIPGTTIDYPILQSDKEKGQFYLTHDFYGTEDYNGSLFLDYRNDFVNRDTNLIVYGHNMKSGAMFGGLKQYLNADYLKEHKTIYFDTIYEKETYEVIGAFLSKVSYGDEYTFRYYNFLNANDEEEYDAFKNNVMLLDAISQEKLDTKYGDKLLTLSTCSSYTEDGRMFIIAKKVENQ